MQTVRITDPFTKLPVQFDAEREWAASTREPDVTRWVLLKAWKLPGGTWKYGKFGQSRIYHQAAGDCRTYGGRLAGAPATVDDLPDDAVPCPQCRPDPPDVLEEAAEAGDMIPVRYEYDRIELHDVDTPDQLIQLAATRRRRDSHQLSVMLGGPARDLIAQLMRDPDFRAGVHAGMPASA